MIVSSFPFKGLKNVSGEIADICKISDQFVDVSCFSEVKD